MRDHRLTIFGIMALAASGMIEAEVVDSRTGVMVSDPDPEPPVNPTKETRQMRRARERAERKRR